MGHVVHPDIQDPGPNSAHPPSLLLWIQQGKHIALMCGAVHVADAGATPVVHEFYPHLHALSLGTSSAQHLGDPV